MQSTVIRLLIAASAIAAVCAQPALAETVAGVTLVTPTTRDALKQPFASNSIWNTPIGKSAVYVPANFPAIPRGDQWAPMPQIDDELIVLRPKAPTTTVNLSSVGWSGGNRCVATGGPLQTVPVPSDLVIPNGKGNNSAVFLGADGRTLTHLQPFTRCAANASATALVQFLTVDLYGDGRLGSHGGSKLSAIGGSLRVGELRPGGQPPRHALKVNVDAQVVLAKCTVKPDCFRWPAYSADSYAVGGYGKLGTAIPGALKMGALLALPATLDITKMGLETKPAQMLAWTLQNYGAYIVDDTYGGSFALAAENGPDGSLRTQFKTDWGYDLEARVRDRDKNPWVRDMQRIVTALAVVDNNTPLTPGGGGAPRQPLAPALK